MTKTPRQRDRQPTSTNGGEVTSHSAIHAQAGTVSIADRRALILSTIAIGVTVCSFAWSEWKDFSKRSADNRRRIYLSYQLGISIGGLLTITQLVALSRKTDIGKETQALAMSHMQGLIDQLDLRVSVREFGSKRDLTFLMQRISERLLTVASVEAENVYAVGVLLGEAREFAFWAKFENDQTLAAHPNAMDHLRKLNRLLSKLGISYQILIPAHYDPDAMMKSLVQADSAVEANWK